MIYFIYKGYPLLLVRSFGYFKFGCIDFLLPTGHFLSERFYFFLVELPLELVSLVAYPASFAANIGELSDDTI